MQELARTSSRLTELVINHYFQHRGECVCVCVLTIFRNVEDSAAIAVGADEFKMPTHLRLLHRRVLNS